MGRRGRADLNGSPVAGGPGEEPGEDQPAGTGPSLRVLLSVRPYSGHFNPCVPLLGALRRAGHQVAVATAPELAGAVVGSGHPWMAAGLSVDDAVEEYGDEVDPDYGAEVVGHKVDDLVAVLSSFPADVLVREPTDLAPALAAELAGVPSVNFGIARFLPRDLWRDIAGDSLAAARANLGLPPDPDLDMLLDDLYIDIVPPSFQGRPRGPVRARQMARYRPWDGGAGREPPAWLATLPDRPTVLVTLGTVYNHDPALFAVFLAALADEDLNVVCTVGDLAPAELDRVPDNVRLARYLPHSLVLPSCRAMLCHGGFNTLMGALCEGVPVVCLPLGSDQYFNANRCDRLGLGVKIVRKGITPETVRRAVRRVLDEPAFGERVGRLRDEIDALPPYRRVVRRIEALAAGGRRGPGPVAPLPSPTVRSGTSNGG